MTGKKPLYKVSFKKFLVSLLITLPMWLATFVIITRLNFSNTYSSIATAGKTRITCTKCGKCVDDCPQKAVYYHIKGTKLNVGAGFARIIFIYTAFIIIAAFGGGFITDALYKTLTFIIK